MKSPEKDAKMVGGDKGNISENRKHPAAVLDLCTSAVTTPKMQHLRSGLKNLSGGAARVN